MKLNKKFFNKKVGAGALALASLGTAGFMLTSASYTDSASSAISVTAGTIALKAGASQSFPINFGSTLKPGETVTKQVVLSNTGTLDLTYTGTTVGATSEPLAGVLETTIKSGATTLVNAKKLNNLTISPQMIPAKTGTQTLDITITWPDRTPALDNPMQGVSGDTTMTFTATQ